MLDLCSCPPLAAVFSSDAARKTVVPTRVISHKHGGPCTLMSRDAVNAASYPMTFVYSCILHMQGLDNSISFPAKLAVQA